MMRNRLRPTGRYPWRTQVWLAAAALLSSSSGFPGPTAAIGMTYGGECTYRPYEGTATVVSVLHREQISSTAETTYEVRFTFSPPML